MVPCIVSATTQGTQGEVCPYPYYIVTSLRLSTVNSTRVLIHHPSHLQQVVEQLLSNTATVMKMYLLQYGEKQNKFDEHGNEQELGINGHGFTASWDEHPDRDEKWKQEELGRIGEERFRREYGCEFLVFDETLVNSIVLSILEGAEPKLNMGQTRWYKKMDPKKTYVVALDPVMGTGGDNAHTSFRIAYI